MKFGKKFDKENLVSDENIEFIRRFRDGATTVRFLQELDEWTEYYECYDQGARGGVGAYFPSPGKNSKYNNGRLSRRFLVNVLVDGRVRLYKVPASMMDRIVRRSDKFGTITDRDYEITRSGSGINVEYDIETGERANIDLAPYRAQMFDHETMLLNSFREVFGHNPDEDDSEDPRPVENKRAPQPDRHVSTSESLPPSEPQQSESGAAEEDEVVLSESQIVS